MKLFLQAAACVLSVFLLTGCAGRRQDVSMTEDEMPYGATMRESKTDFAVPMAYDRRFVNEEQVAAVANYFAAIQNQDAELYLASALPLYTEYQIDEVYSYQDTGELIAALHKGIADQTGEDFQFNMISINEFVQDTSFGGLEAMIDLLDHVSDADQKFSEQMQGAWALELEWNLLYDNQSSSGAVDSQWVYLFQIDNQYYCCM